MIALFVRFVGLWFVAGGLAALVIDATRSIAASEMMLTPLGVSLSTVLGPTALTSAQTFVQRIEVFVGAWLWDPAILWFLSLPTWGVLGAIGFVLTYLGRLRRLRPIYA